MAAPTLKFKEAIWRNVVSKAVCLIVGYQGITTLEFDERTKPLLAEHGHDKFWQGQGAGLVVRHDLTARPNRMKLKQDARPFVWPFIGPDPESPPWWVKDWTPVKPIEPLRPFEPKPESEMPGHWVYAEKGIQSEFDDW